MLLCESLSSCALGIQKRPRDCPKCAPGCPKMRAARDGLAAALRLGWTRGAFGRRAWCGPALPSKRFVAPPAAEAATANPRARTRARDHS